ncbi:hypothetical protein M2284_003645 [Rhodococcus sp. LBL1]|nr:hypothetical protein [Rhodococcus sp. LBL1]MDH6685438.1 hypothetical protein [Rhodococcus sp. LBL2]
MVDLRWRRRPSQQAIAARLNVAASTAHVALLHCQLNRLWTTPHPGTKRSRRRDLLLGHGFVHTVINDHF